MISPLILTCPVKLHKKPVLSNRHSKVYDMNKKTNVTDIEVFYDMHRLAKKFLMWGSDNMTNLRGRLKATTSLSTSSTNGFLSCS